MRLRPSTINHRLPTCQPTARVYGLLDRVGDALAEERERLELKAIEMTRRNNEQTVAGRHRMMRRADREVADPQQVEAIIATCKIVSLAYTDAGGHHHRAVEFRIRVRHGIQSSHLVFPWFCDRT